MSGSNTLKMLKAVFVRAPVIMFLSGFFKNVVYHNQSKVEYDIVRSGEKLALVLKDACTGYHINNADVFTNKEITPPVLGEQMDFEACTLTDRDAGQEVHEDNKFRAKALTRVFNGLILLIPMFHRTMELQAATVLQTGICSLPGSDGEVAYLLDYQAKPTHFPVAALPWTDPASDKIADVGALAKINKKDGKRRSNILIFGATAWDLWINDDNVQKLLDNLRYEVGKVDPDERGEDATWMGMIKIQGYKFEMWTYDSDYEDPADNNVLKPYISDDSVIVMSDKAEFDTAFGSVGSFRPADARAVAWVPRTVRSASRRLGLYLNAWFSPSGETFSCGLKGRPILIPKEIDTFGCLTVQ